MKLVRIPAVLFLLGASITAAHASSALSLGQAAGFNVFVFSNFTEYNTDSQGAMAIGGNFAPASGGSFTINANNVSVNGYGLVVGGSFNQTGNSMGGGTTYVGGNMTWTNPSMNGDTYVVGNFANNTNGGSTNGTIYYGGTYTSGDALTHQHVNPGSITSPIDFQTAQTSLQGLSAQLAADAANGTVSKSYSTYTLTGTSSTLNVFNMTDYSYSGATINISAPAGSTVVVNVPGTASSFSNGSINLSGVSENHVIFNFSQATTLAVGGIAFDATILAPFADFTGTWGQLNGELIAKSASGTTQFNSDPFNGYLGTSGSAPEPSTWAMFAGAFLLLGFKRFQIQRQFNPAAVLARLRRR